MGGAEVSLRDALLSDSHAHAVFAVRGERVSALNQTASRLFRRDMVGRALRELFDETSVAKIGRMTADGIRAGTTELQLEHANEPPETVRFSVFTAADGELLFIGLPPGITYPEEFGARLMAANEETTQLLRQLSRDVRHARSARESLQEISGLRELFITALAHDIRSPLNAILITEAVLRKTARTATPHDLERHALQVERSARSIVELIDSVLLAAHLDAPDVHLSRQRLQLDEIALEWVHTLTPVAAQGGVRMDVVVRSSPRIDADRVRIGEVISNLLSNAIRYSPPEGRVLIDIGAEAGRAVCSVADEGPGVPAPMREQIFEKFVQGTGARGNSGLGLYISRRIIDLHGGRLWVEDNEPTGARFRFDLPLAPDDDSSSR